MCISAYKGNRFGITIETTPKAVIINHDDTVANNALFSENANSIVNRDKDYILTVLQTQINWKNYSSTMVPSEVSEQSVKYLKEERQPKISFSETGYEQLLLQRTSTTTLTARVNSKLNRNFLQHSWQNNRQRFTPI
jgi:hypothetical protein